MDATSSRAFACAASVTDAGCSTFRQKGPRCITFTTRQAVRAVCLASQSSTLMLPRLLLLSMALRSTIGRSSSNRLTSRRRLSLGRWTTCGRRPKVQARAMYQALAQAREDQARSRAQGLAEAGEQQARIQAQALAEARGPQARAQALAEAWDYEQVQAQARVQARAEA
jgi:hypothetical protein